VGNTNTTGVTWSSREGTGNGTLSVSGNNATYTAPTTPGTYHVDVKNTIDPTKTATCAITVPPVTISVSADRTFINPGDGASITATIGGASNQQATWVLAGAGTIFPTTGAITGFGSVHSGTVRITGTAVADPSKSDFVDIDVQDGVEP
jgi:exosome complex RNA-binding protein Csl4